MKNTNVSFVITAQQLYILLIPSANFLEPLLVIPNCLMKKNMGIVAQFFFPRLDSLPVAQAIASKH